MARHGKLCVVLSHLCQLAGWEVMREQDAAKRSQCRCKLPLLLHTSDSGTCSIPRPPPLPPPPNQDDAGQE
eukprot:6019868-Amphidinium_carterae.1